MPRRRQQAGTPATGRAEPTAEQEAAHLGEVDVNPRVDQATESDEEKVLARIYGEPDENGVYCGEPETGDDDVEKGDES